MEEVELPETTIASEIDSDEDIDYQSPAPVTISSSYPTRF